MRAQLVQTYSGCSAAYQVFHSGELVYEAATTPSPVRLKAVLRQNGRDLYSIYGGDWLYKRNESQVRDQGRRQLHICEVRSPQEEAVGRICYELGGWGRPPLYRVDLGGRRWTVYQVGLGRQGLKFPVYDEGERQIALLEKGVVVKDNLDSYDLFALDQTGILVSTLFGIYYDWKEFSNRGEYACRKTSATLVFTLKKSVKERYDPGFRDTCPP